MPTIQTFPNGRGIVCFGDSITFSASTRADRSYPAILDEALFSQGVSVGNNGISGGTVQHAQDSYTLRHKGRGLWGACLLLGVNDLAAGSSATTIFTALNSLVQEMLTDGLRVVLCTVLPWKNGDGWSAPRQVITEALNESILALDGTNELLRVVDGYEAFGDLSDPTLLQRALQELTPDNLHLGSYGTQSLAKLFQPAVQDLLAEDIPAPTDTTAPVEGVLRIKQNDTYPKLSTVLRDPVTQLPIDLTLATSAALRIRKADSTVLHRSAVATIVDPPTSGKLEYAWQAGDTAEAGDYYVEWSVFFGYGNVKTYPHNDYNLLVIVPSWYSPN